MHDSSANPDAQAGRTAHVYILKRKSLYSIRSFTHTEKHTTCNQAHIINSDIFRHKVISSCQTVFSQLVQARNLQLLMQD